MSDFRVTVPSADDSVYREIEWDHSARLWSASEKEMGDVRWSGPIIAAPADLAALRDFFLIEPNLDANIALRMSPGELVQVHEPQEETGLLAVLCTQCGEHWIVFRLTGGSWLKYGRTCNFGWMRGQPVTPDSDDDLQRALKAEKKMRGKKQA